MASPKRHFDFTGGHLALDFANTLDHRGTGQEKDMVPDYGALLTWAGEARIVNDEQFETLWPLARFNPGKTSYVLRDAALLRESLYAIFSAVARNEVAPESALKVLNALWQSGRSATRLVADAGHQFRWAANYQRNDLLAVLYPIANAAVELLTSGELARVRECASDSCAWLFLDNTKNQRRRWCSMKTCGNRDKARRFYARKKLG
jgi:predicted RNA-binding Zn ribbon-like protein